MTSDANPPAAKGAMRWVLIVSLALNAFVLAAVIGNLLFHGGGRRHFMSEILEDASPALQRKAEQMRAQRAEANQASIEVSAGAEAEILAALRAPAFEPEVMLDAQRRIRDASNNARAVLHRGVVELATEMSPEFRARLADGFEELFERRRKRREHRAREREKR